MSGQHQYREPAGRPIGHVYGITSEGETIQVATIYLDNAWITDGEGKVIVRFDSDGKAMPNP
jgi:hypothetical protein